VTVTLCGTQCPKLSNLKSDSILEARMMVCFSWNIWIMFNIIKICKFYIIKINSNILAKLFLFPALLINTSLFKLLDQESTSLQFHRKVLEQKL
jgi:hypothetical protein